MQKYLLLLLPALIYGEDFFSLLKLADNNLLLQAKSQEVTAKEALYKAAKAKDYPTLDAKLSAIYLKDTPTASFQLPFPGIPQHIQMGKKPNYSVEIALTYPLFTGFAISSLIDKAKLDAAKAHLEKADAKRRLYMQIATLYGALYSVKGAITANQHAKEATETSWKKANGFFKAGLLAPSDLENIRAKKYEISAALQELKSQKRGLLRLLSYLTDTKITQIAQLPHVSLPSREMLMESALHAREDIAALHKALEMDKQDLKLAKSARYPSLALIGALKSQGDTLRLNGDGFSNPNKSYIGAAVEYKLFDGFATKAQIEAAKAKKMGRLLYLRDYERKVETTLESEMDTLEALLEQKEAKEAQYKAQESYYRLTKGRFANHLAGADELSRAIAARATAQAQYQAIEAKIFEQKCKILLESSLKTFTKGMGV